MQAGFERVRARGTVDRCFHEAGHAVAAALRGARPPEAEVTGAASWRDLDGGCRRWEIRPLTARPFVAFAGPWAQARSAWERGLEDGIESSGPDLAGHVSRALLAHPRDAAGVAVAEFGVAATLQGGGVDDADCLRVLRGAEFAWRRELEGVWPVVVEVALTLDRGADVALADVRRLAEVRVAELS